MRAARSLGLTADAEMTLEANPESVTAATLEQFREAGVNRLSFGVQSFRDEELKRLGRLHSAERAAQAVELARAAGFDNVSIDLMMWLPGQDVAQWLASVDAAIRVSAGSPVALHPRGLPASPAQAGDRSPRLDAGAG